MFNLKLNQTEQSKYKPEQFDYSGRNFRFWFDFFKDYRKMCSTENENFNHDKNRNKYNVEWFDVKLIYFPPGKLTFFLVLDPPSCNLLSSNK